jgi:hypothetical protein
MMEVADPPGKTFGNPGAAFGICGVGAIVMVRAWKIRQLMAEARASQRVGSTVSELA